MRFRSYLDGSEQFMGPETSMEIQANLGSDIALVFDECTPFHVDARVHAALDRAHPPLARPLPGLARRARARRASSSTASCRAASTRTCGSRARRRSPARACDGIAIGGSLGADKAQMYEVVRWATATLDAAGDERPRHLLGIGEIDDLVAGVAARDRHLRLRDADAARRATAWRSSRTRAGAGASTSRRPRHRDSDEPLMEGCPCPTCAIGWTRGYLRYMAHNRELTVMRALTLHNLAFVQRVVARLREAVLAGRLEDEAAALLGGCGAVGWLVDGGD